MVFTEDGCRLVPVVPAVVVTNGIGTERSIWGIQFDVTEVEVIDDDNDEIDTFFGKPF